MDEIRCKIIGRVQGVFFRAYIKDVADKIGVVGEVSNESDGTVHVLAQGRKYELEDFIEKVREGSPSAKVESLDVDWQHPTGYHEHFRILF